MLKAEWLKRVDEFIKEIENDMDIDDDEIAEILGELNDKAAEAYNGLSDDDEDDEDDK